MREPLVISFGVIDDVRRWSLDASGRAILLVMQPIAPAHLNGRPPTHARVLAMLENGKFCHLTIPVRLWESAVKDPTYFVEGADVRGPTAEIKGPSVRG
jgi:hypothetical protein